ncbi:MAG: flagellar motor switch protein FliN [Planctomycetaceae bacterium]|jgi:flagellar motor switch protein FliN/FliY|nr:flagellar motor switch protein FliN [Planctomycetaceae bacterium]
MSDDGVLDQSDIERLLSGGGNTGNTAKTGNAENTGNTGAANSSTTNSSGNSSAEGTISQSDLDALFGSGSNNANSGDNQTTSGATTSGDGTISQSELDALFGGTSSSPQSPTTPPSKPSASGPLDQSDLDALFQNSTGIGNKETTPPPGPIDQAALDVLFGSSSTKPTINQSEPTFVPSTPYDPTQPSIPPSVSGYGNGGASSGIGGGGGGSFVSPPDMGDDDEEGLPRGDLNYLLDRADKSIQSIVSERLIPAEVMEFQFPEFGGTVPSAEHATLDQISEVELNVKIELGRTDMYLEDVLKLRKGSVVPLDKTAGDPVDIYVNGRLLARGEVLVMNENFCVRVAELLAGAIPME